MCLKNLIIIVLVVAIVYLLLKKDTPNIFKDFVNNNKVVSFNDKPQEIVIETDSLDKLNKSSSEDNVSGYESSNDYEQMILL